MSTNEVEAEVWRDQVRKIQREGGGPAFPVSDTSHMIIGTQIEGALITRGMTLRDHFAGLALAECIRVANDKTTEPDPLLSELFRKASIYAYFAADAMLKARES